MRVSWIVACVWLAAAARVSGFAPRLSNSRVASSLPSYWTASPRVLKSSTEPEEDDEPVENPYADPNYPDLEFVNYDDPEYSVDQGVGDEFFSPGDTEEQIEAMREDRRRRNDEFQFETYFADVLKNGDEYKGEWTVYKTDFKRLDPNGFPRFIKARRTLKVISKGYKVIIDPNAKWRVDGERICHEEVVVPDSESDPYIEWQQDIDVDQGFGRHEPPSAGKEVDKLTADSIQMEQEIMANKYWPDEMSSMDLRGHQGNMCVGNAYTICTAVPISQGGQAHEGPFAEMRTELGIQSKQMRFRVKFDYRVDDEAAKKECPPLKLQSLTVCRETQEMWPRDVSGALFGAPGALGGLYDPPPVGSEEQSGRYMLLDLDGGATLLFPYEMDQDPDAFEGNGWVTSLDWTPGTIRYQVDRKVHGGKGILGLRTLELSEVQGVDADTYRPRDGGMDMRQ